MRFRLGEQVYVTCLNMTAKVIGVAGDQYRILRADGKYDCVMANGLEKIKQVLVVK